MSIRSNKLNPTATTFLEELKDECLSTVKIIHQLEIEHLTEDQTEEVLGNLMASITHLPIHSAIVKEELDKVYAHRRSVTKT